MFVERTTWRDMDQLSSRRMKWIEKADWYYRRNISIASVLTVEGVVGLH